MEKSSAPNRFIVSTNVVIQIILGAVICIFANLAIERWHPHKLDLSISDYYKLSDKTKQLLKSLKSTVDVIVFFQPNSTDDVAQRVYNDIQNLVKEYEAESGNIKVRYVDPNLDNFEAEKLKSDYSVKDLNVVVFVFKGRSKYVNVNDMVEFDRSENPFSQSNRIKAFKGEQQFTSAIQNVCDAKPLKVYFLEGHGEGDIQNEDLKNGYSEISALIQHDNLIPEKLNIFQKQEIPKDCDVLIINGPSKSISEPELKAISDYLAQDGRMMVLVDGLHHDSGLEKILSDHGVKLGNDIVVVKIRDQLGGEALLEMAPGNEYTNHIITESLRKDGLRTIFPLARSVDQISPNTSKRKITVLVTTPDGGDKIWAETNLELLQHEEQGEFDEKDRKGIIPLGVAVEPSTAGDMEREGMRLVVFGSSGFIRNENLQKGGNSDLMMNSLNWLLKRQQLIGIAPKTVNDFSLSMDLLQQRALFTTEVILIPFSVALIGIAVWFKRRR